MKTAITHLMLTTLLLVASVSTWAYDVQVNGIYYNLNKENKTASVTYKTTGYNSYSGSVSVPATFEYCGVTYSVTSIGEYAFYYCNGLSSVTIPNTVILIEKSAFAENNYNLKSVNIPDAVTRIEDSAFSRCYNLDVTLPKNLISIGNFAFYFTGQTSVTLPEGLQTIGNGAFWGDYITSVSIPSSVTEIGEYPFRTINADLVSISVDEKNTIYNSASNCNAIIETKTKTLIQGCENTIILEDITSIANGAFAGCTIFKTINIPNSVVSIGDDAFQGCSGLTSVTIPNSVTSIGSDAFYFCTSLTSVYNYATTPQTLSSSSVFSNVANCTLYVPETALEAYKAANYWKKFKDIKAIPPTTLALTDAEPTITEGTYDAGNVTYTRNVTTGKYATFCLPFDVDMSTMSAQIEKAYTIAPWCVNTTFTGLLKLMVNEVESDAVISAGTPFLAKMTASPVVFTNCNEVTFDATTANPEPISLTVYDNDGGSVLKENKKLIVKMGGTYSKMTELDTDNYRAFTTSGSFGPCSWLNCFRAYVYKDDSNSSARIQNIILDFGEDSATGIGNIESPSENSVKTCYNLNGQRVSSTTAPGLYIVNGKKIIK